MGRSVLLVVVAPQSVAKTASVRELGELAGDNKAAVRPADARDREVQTLRQVLSALLEALLDKLVEAARMPWEAGKPLMLERLVVRGEVVGWRAVVVAEVL